MLSLCVAASGNGFPIGGVVTSPALAAAFAAGGMEYFNTYGGSNAAVAAGRAVLREIRDRGLQQHADEVGRCVLVSPGAIWVWCGCQGVCLPNSARSRHVQSGLGTHAARITRGICWR